MKRNKSNVARQRDITLAYKTKRGRKKYSSFNTYDESIRNLLISLVGLVRDFSKLSKRKSMFNELSVIYFDIWLLLNSKNMLIL